MTGTGSGYISSIMGQVSACRSGPTREEQVLAEQEHVRPPEWVPP
jgi:hypothetical protein